VPVIVHGAVGVAPKSREPVEIDQMSSTVSLSTLPRASTVYCRPAPGVPAPHEAASGRRSAGPTTGMVVVPTEARALAREKNDACTSVEPSWRCER